MFSRFLPTLTLLSAIAFPALAQAPLQPKTGLEPKLFDRTGRTITEHFPYVRTLATTSCVETATVVAAIPRATSATQRVNIHGYIVGFAPGLSTTGITLTTSIAPMNYAGKVRIGITDVSNDTRPACLSYRIDGDSWNGTPQSETVVSTSSVAISETIHPTTSKSWSRITRVRLAGCNEFDADDLVHIRHTAQVALRYRVSTAAATSDVISVCLDNIGTGGSAANSRCAHPSSISFDTDVDANTVNFLDTDLGPGAALLTCPTDGSSFFIKYRASPYAVTY